MPEQEFELYLDLLARLLRMSPKQKEAIASELRDHLEARFEELVRAGMPRDKAIRRALEEFGDTAGLAHQFTQLSRRQMRRWIMRGTLATAAVGAVILLVLNAFLPDEAVGPAPQQIAAQDDSASHAELPSDATDAVAEWDVECVDPLQFVSLLHPDLAKPVNVEFDETTLEDLIEAINRKISLPVALDVKNLLLAGVSELETVSFPRREDPLYVRLSRELQNVAGVPLSWYISDDVLVVTTAEIASEHRQTIFYDIHDLLARGFTTDDLIGIVQNYTSGPWFDLDGIGGTIGRFELFGELLVVRHTHHVQLEVAAFLEVLLSEAGECQPRPPVHRQLEAALDRPVTIDFSGDPLTDVVSALSEEVDARIELDVENLLAEGISPVEEIAIRMSDPLPLRTVLRYMLANVAGVALAAITDDGRILITTAEIADKTSRPVVYNVSDLVGDDSHKLRALVDWLQNEIRVPWFDLDGQGGTIEVPLPGLFIVQLTDAGHAEVRAQIKQLRALAATNGDSGIDGFAGSDELETRHYQMDAATAENLLTTLPETVAAGTWAGTIGADGLETTIAEDGIGVIHFVVAGHKVVALSGGQISVDSQSVEAIEENGTESPPGNSVQSHVAGDKLIIPQAILVVRHKRSVHHQIRGFLSNLSVAPARTFFDDPFTFIPSIQDAHSGNGGTGFFSVADQAAKGN